MPDLLKAWLELRSHRRPFRLLAALILARTGAARFLTIRHRDYVLRFDHGAAALRLWVDADSRQDEDFFCAYLQPGDIVLDLGANIGTLSLVASRGVGESGRVYSVEAHPETFAILNGNVAYNRRTNITTFQCALAADNGTLLFQEHDDDTQNAVAVGDLRGIEVPARRLDDLPLGEGPIALLKIDVEGYELLVIEGGSKTLERTDCIYLEVYDKFIERYGYTCEQLWARLREKGFLVYRLEGASHLLPVPPDYVSSRCENYLAVRDVDRAARRMALHASTSA